MVFIYAYIFLLKVLSENWVVYHYFNLRAHRYEMSVIEIYDQSRAVLLLIFCFLFYFSHYLVCIENKDATTLLAGK